MAKKVCKGQTVKDFVHHTEESVFCRIKQWGTNDGYKGK